MPEEITDNEVKEELKEGGREEGKAMEEEEEEVFSSPEFSPPSLEENEGSVTKGNIEGPKGAVLSSQNSSSSLIWKSAENLCEETAVVEDKNSSSISSQPSKKGLAKEFPEYSKEGMPGLRRSHKDGSFKKVTKDKNKKKDKKGQVTPSLDVENDGPRSSGGSSRTVDSSKSPINFLSTDSAMVNRQLSAPGSQSSLRSSSSFNKCRKQENSNALSHSQSASNFTGGLGESGNSSSGSVSSNSAGNLEANIRNGHEQVNGVNRTNSSEVERNSELQKIAEENVQTENRRRDCDDSFREDRLTPGHDDEHNSNRYPGSQRSGSGGDSASEEQLHQMLCLLRQETLSRSSESTRSFGGKEKSPAQPPGEKDKKKKAWYSMLNPTYKSRSEDLKKLFKELPSDERLISDYSCALQKDILVHGRLYVTPNYLCFYSKIFGWETFLTIRCKDIVSMTKEKTALVIPNAIQISTDTDKHFLTTFSARDKSYMMLFRIWQNALLDQQISHGELWQWVHTCYGDELGLTSDDDDYVAPSTEDDQKSIKDSYRALQQQASERSTTSSVSHASAPLSSTKDRRTVSPQIEENEEMGSEATDVPHVEATTDDSPPRGKGSESPQEPPKHRTRFSPFRNSSKSSSKHHKHSSSVSPSKSNGMKMPTDSEDSDATPRLTGPEVVPIRVCPNAATYHSNREIINKVFTIPIDSLFTLLFTNSKMMLHVYNSRKITDVVYSPWKTKSDSEDRVRTVTYNVTLPTNAFGPKVSHVTETQIMSKLSRPGEYYSLDSEAANAGIPYGDNFLVCDHWCLLSENSNSTRLSVYAEVVYKKSMWGFMKSVIDKNSYAALEDLLKQIDQALQQEVIEPTEMMAKIPSSSRRRRRRGGSKIEGEQCGGANSVQPSGVASPGVKEGVIGSRYIGSNNSHLLMRSANAGSSLLSAPANPSTSVLTVHECTNTSSTFYSKCMLGCMFFLLLANVLLMWWHLWQLEVAVSDPYSPVQHLLAADPSIIERAGGASSEAWLSLLQEQETVHSRQMGEWRRGVGQAAHLLKQAEVLLREMHSAIPSEHATKVATLLSKLQSPELLGSHVTDPGPQ